MIKLVSKVNWWGLCCSSKPSLTQWLHRWSAMKVWLVWFSKARYICQYQEVRSLPARRPAPVLSLRDAVTKILDFSSNTDCASQTWMFEGILRCRFWLKVMGGAESLHLQPAVPRLQVRKGLQEKQESGDSRKATWSLGRIPWSLPRKVLDFIRGCCPWDPQCSDDFCALSHSREEWGDVKRLFRGQWAPARPHRGLLSSSTWSVAQSQWDQFGLKC